MDKVLNNDLLYRLNKFICVLFCVWFAWPYANYKLGMYVGVALSLGWIITTGRFLVLKKWSADLVFIVAYFITFIPYVLTGEFEYSSFNPYSILGTFYLFFIGSFMFQYYRRYKSDKKFLGKIAFITIIFYVLGAVQTYIGLHNFPNAARVLAVGGLDYQYREMYSNMGIGGFNFVYSSCFLAIMLIHPLRKEKNTFSKKTRFLLFVGLIILLLMILKASYAIAILITLFGIGMVFVVRNKTSFYLLLIILLLTLFIIPKEVIAQILMEGANLFHDNKIISEKFSDLAKSFVDVSSSSQTGYRFELYFSSLKTFIENPLFGINGPFGKGDFNVGGHSGWFDMMAYFGLFTVIPLFSAIYFNFKKIRSLARGTNSYGYIITIQFLFIIYGVINPLLYIYQIGLIIFLVVPSVPYMNCIRIGSKVRNRTFSKRGEI